MDKYEMADHYAKWIGIEWSPEQREIAASYFDMLHGDGVYPYPGENDDKERGNGTDGD